MYICGSCRNVMAGKEKTCAFCGSGAASKRRIMLTSPVKWFIGEAIYLMTAFFLCLLADSLLKKDGDAPLMMAAGFRLFAYVLALMSLYFLVMMALSIFWQARLPRYSKKEFSLVLKDARVYKDRVVIRSKAMRFVSMGFLALAILIFLLVALSAVDLAYAAKYEKPLFPALHSLSTALFSLLLM